MASSVRELIFQNVQSTIQGLSTGAGYNYTVEEGNVIIIHGKRDDSAYVEPIIYIYPSAEFLNEEKSEKGKDYNELMVDVEAWIRGDRSDMNTNINKMLADLKKILAVDPTRGGYAITTDFMASDVFLGDLTSDKCGIVLSLRIGYEHTYGNPYSN